MDPLSTTDDRYVRNWLYDMLGLPSSSSDHIAARSKVNMKVLAGGYSYPAVSLHRIREYLMFPYSK